MAVVSVLTVACWDDTGADAETTASTSVGSTGHPPTTSTTSTSPTGSGGSSTSTSTSTETTDTANLDGITHTTTDSLETTTTGTDGSSESTASTGEPSPICGDGIAEVPEMCDGGPHCQADCTYPSGLVFWTEVLHPADANNNMVTGFDVDFDADGDPVVVYFYGGIFPGFAGSTVVKHAVEDGSLVWWTVWWNAQWTITSGYDILADESGEYVLAGGVGSDAWFGALTMTGAIDWGRTHDPAGSQRFTDIGRFSDGTYVGIGMTQSAPADRHGLIVKLDAGHFVEWAVDHDGPVTGLDRFVGGVVLPGDELVVFGCCSDLGSWMLRSYDATGAPGWTTEIAGLADPEFEPYKLGAITLDHEGNLLAAWQLTDGTPWLGKYTPAGVELWASALTDPGIVDATFSSVAATPQGRIVLAGRHQLPSMDADIWYGVLDTDGNYLWHDIVDGSANLHDQIEGIAVDDYGRVVVTGRVSSHGMPGDLEGWTRMFAP